MKVAAVSGYFWVFNHDALFFLQWISANPWRPVENLDGRRETQPRGKGLESRFRRPVQDLPNGGVEFKDRHLFPR